MVLGMSKMSEREIKTSKYTSEMNPLGIAHHKNRSRMRISIDIASAIFQKDGMRGFYRGYIASLTAYVPNSALWWTFYHLYQGKLNKINNK